MSNYTVFVITFLMDSIFHLFFHYFVQKHLELLENDKCQHTFITADKAQFDLYYLKSLVHRENDLFIYTENRFPLASISHSITLVYIVFQKVVLIKNNILPQTFN